jgi:hypothetical protein
VRLSSVQAGGVSVAPQRNNELAVIPVPVSLSSGDNVMLLVTTPDVESGTADGRAGGVIDALMVDENVAPTTSEPVYVIGVAGP